MIQALLDRWRIAFDRWWQDTKERWRWGSLPVDAGHDTYRRQYEKLLPVLPNLPRGIDHPNKDERRRTILFLAELVDGLHNYGDDPIMPPRIRKVIREIKDEPLWTPNMRLADFGTVGKRTFLGTVTGGQIGLWVGGGLLAFGMLGWGAAAIKSNESARYLAERNQAQSDLERAEADAAILATQLQTAQAARDTARRLAESNAQTVAQERRIRQRAEAEARRIRNAEAQARSNSDTFDYGFGGVSNAEPVSGTSGDGAGAGPNNPR